MAKDILSDLNFNSVAKITNLPDPTAAQHAATKAYVDSLVQGLNWKDNVRVASTANINLSSPGTTIDGVTMSANDRFLAKNQSTASENGIYIFNGSGVAATRASDADTANEILNAIVVVDEGTANADTSWRCDTVGITLGSTSLSFVSFGAAAPSASESTAGVAEIATQGETDAGSDDSRFITPLKLATYTNRKLKNSTTIGDGSATQIDVTHNFGTRDLVVYVRKNSGNYDQVLCDISMPDTNTVRLNFASAPSSSALRVTILG